MALCLAAALAPTAGRAEPGTSPRLPLPTREPSFTSSSSIGRVTGHHQAAARVREADRDQGQLRDRPLREHAREGSPQLQRTGRPVDRAGDLVWIGEYAENGWIQPISKFSGDASITDPNLNLKSFFPLLLNAFGTWGGTTYGLPFDNYSGLLFYNKCMLKDAGFDKPPATWDEVMTTYGRSSPTRPRSNMPTRCSLCAARRSRPTASCASSGLSAARCSTRISTRT